jgi:hypothetical protein
MNKSKRQSLEQSIMINVRNGKAFQRFTNEGADLSLKNDTENEIESLESFAVFGLFTVME